MLKKIFVVTFLVSIFITGIVKAADPVVVEHWYDVPESQRDAYKEMIDRFNETHIDVQVDWMNIPSRQLEQKLVIASQVGDLPDTFVLNSNSAAQFMAMGVAAPLNEYIKDWEMKDNINDSLWEIARYGDDILALPWKMQIRYLYYRADWFKEKGIEPPETMKELTEAAIKMTEDNNGDGRIDRYGIGLRGNGGTHSLNTYIWAFGGDYLDENGNVIFNSEETLDAVKWFIDLHRKHKVSPPTAPTDGFQQLIGNFKSGKTAIQNHHIGTYAELEEAMGDKVSAIPIPAGYNGNRGTLGTVHMHVISAYSDKKEAAAEFIKFMSEEWAVDHQSRKIGSIPVLDSVASNPFYQNNRFYKASIESIPFVKAPPKAPEFYVLMNEVINVDIQKALMGEITAEEMVKEIHDSFEELLNK